MKYVQCPRCSARFHTGVIYESIDACSRCGAPLVPRWPRFLDRLRAPLVRGGTGNSLDWEAITGSQYVRRHVVLRSVERPGGNTPSPA